MNAASKPDQNIVLRPGIYDGDWIGNAVIVKDAKGATHRIVVDRSLQMSFPLECVVRVANGKATVATED